MSHCAKTSICSTALRYLDMESSPQSSTARFFKLLLLNRNWFDCESYILLRNQILAVQRNSSLNRPVSHLLCFLSLAQQVQWKKLVVELAGNSSVQSTSWKESTLFSLLVGYHHTNRARIMLEKTSLYQFPTPQNLQHRNIFQTRYNTALAFSLLQFAG